MFGNVFFINQCKKKINILLLSLNNSKVDQVAPTIQNIF